MKLGIVGLGKMGGNMAERLLASGHVVVGFDTNVAARDRLTGRGGFAADSIAELVRALGDGPRTVWIMVPAGAPVDDTLAALAPLLVPGDTVIDGGNSFYKDSMRRARTLAERGMHFVDVGTSGGVWGLTEGYSLMIGGDAEVCARLEPLWKSLAPSPSEGWGRVGPAGAGHFVKMVHNGVEYGMMQALAEGFAIFERKTELGLDLAQIARVWRVGSVVRSWLLDLTARALAQNATLEGIAPYVSDSGEGRWTVAEAIDLDVPAPVITHSLIARLRSRDARSFADRLLAAMRAQFGGHAIKSE